MGLRYQLLDPQRQISALYFRDIERFLDLVHGWNIGWHYVIDLAWIYERARSWPAGARVLDAGGGSGPAQYLLLEMGFDVTNVDLYPQRPSFAERRRYKSSFAISKGLTATPSLTATPYLRHLAGAFAALKKVVRGSGLWPWLRLLRDRPAFAERCDAWRRSARHTGCPPGRLRLLRGNLCSLPDFSDGHFDAVVSVSALEHAPAADIPTMLAELRRVVRADGHWAITTSATHRSETWLHEPAMGFCFSTADLRRLFDAVPADDACAEDLLAAYRCCTYLEQHLAPLYRKSGRLGMPWGRWDPQYLPVGLFQ